VTYNLHVMLRFELELAMLEGSRGSHLPEAWRAGMRERLRIAPADDHETAACRTCIGMGVIGGVFQGYTIGNILAAQCCAAALSAHPEIPARSGGANFINLRGWLTESIYPTGANIGRPS
jgi:carboxypeptidase Taq